jgi:2-(1,2-epoxy-1,2-dihydrophenyl)acetyl-CoA isomerase
MIWFDIWPDIADNLLRTLCMPCGGERPFSYMKRNMNAAESGTLKDLLDLEAWHHSRTGMTEDREAARGFVEKREPQFKGK